MFRDKRSLKELLTDRSGSGVLEGLGGIALLIIVLGVLAVGIASSMQAVTTISTKAERQALLTSLVGDEHSTTWGTPASPVTKMVALPNGHDVPVTTWREATPVSTRLTAVTPISADTDAADCSGPSALAKTGCVYSTRVHSKNMDELLPDTVVRKHPSMTGAPIGSVDTRVSTRTPLPQGATLTQFRPTAPTGSKAVLRYLIEVQPLDDAAEIVITQGDDTLATIPADSGTHSYFGTFTAATTSDVRVHVSAGNAIVNSVLLYTAGSTR